MNMEQLYVSASRAKASVTLYTDDKEAVKAAVRHSSQKLAALDIRPEAADGGAAKRQKARDEWLHRQRRDAYVARVRAAWMPRHPRTGHNPRINPKGTRPMKDDGDDNGKKVLRPDFSPSSIRTRLQQGQKGKEPAAKAAGGPAEILPLDPALPGIDTDKVDPLPKPGDAYKVHGRRGNKPDLTLDFVLKDYSYEGFSYATFERVRLVVEKPGGSPVLVVRFHGSVVTEAVIEGRHLDSLYHGIGRHKLPWIWEHPDPARFADETAMLVSRISFRQVER